MVSQAGIARRVEYHVTSCRHPTQGNGSQATSPQQALDPPRDEGHDLGDVITGEAPLTQIPPFS